MDLLAFSVNQVEAWFEWGGYFVLFGLLFLTTMPTSIAVFFSLIIAGVSRSSRWAAADAPRHRSRPDPVAAAVTAEAVGVGFVTFSM